MATFRSDPAEGTSIEEAAGILAAIAACTAAGAEEEAAAPGSERWGLAGRLEAMGVPAQRDDLRRSWRRSVS